MLRSPSFHLKALRAQGLGRNTHRRRNFRSHRSRAVILKISHTQLQNFRVAPNALRHRRRSRIPDVVPSHH